MQTQVVEHALAQFRHCSYVCLCTEVLIDRIRVLVTGEVEGVAIGVRKDILMFFESQTCRVEVLGM